MFSFLAFLEECGVDSDFFGATRAEIASRAQAADLEPAIQRALEHAHPKQLAALLGARIQIVCSVAPGRDDEDDEERQPQRDDDEEIRAATAAMVRRVA